LSFSKTESWWHVVVLLLLLKFLWIPMEEAFSVVPLPTFWNGIMGLEIPSAHDFKSHAFTMVDMRWGFTSCDELSFLGILGGTHGRNTRHILTR
jgi:hypothetical protein